MHYHVQMEIIIMMYIIDKNASTDERKIATVLSLSKAGGISAKVARIDQPKADTSNITDEDEYLTDSDILISQIFDKDTYMLEYPIFQGICLDTLSLNVITKYSAETKLCIYTSGGLYKALNVGDKTGIINFDLLEGENVPQDESVTQFETSSHFMALKVDSVFKPIFYNLNNMANPTRIYFKIVGNDNTSGSSLLTGKILAL